MTTVTTATHSIPAAKRKWSHYRHPASTIRFVVILAILAFLAYSIAYLNIDLSCILGAFPRLAEILATGYFPPDMHYVSDADFLRSVLRTLEMSLLAGFFGVVCSIPIAWLAARNITVSKRIAYPFGRFAIMSSRSIHETIWTILFATVLGFGMLAGTLALTVFCIGFAGKLFSDELEAIDMGLVEALRSVGATSVPIRGSSASARSLHRHRHLHMGCGFPPGCVRVLALLVRFWRDYDRCFAPASTTAPRICTFH